MKRKIPALLLALLLVFSAALPASAAGRACLRSSPASACTRLPACWRLADAVRALCAGDALRAGAARRAVRTGPALRQYIRPGL